MPRPNHLTRSDVRFLGAASRDIDRKFAALEAAEEELVAAADAAGVRPDFRALDALVDAEDELALGDPARLDGALSEYRSQLGRIRRGEVAPRDERADETREALREIRELRAEWAAADEPSDDDCECEGCDE